MEPFKHNFIKNWGEWACFDGKWEQAWGIALENGQEILVSEGKEEAVGKRWLEFQISISRSLVYWFVANFRTLENNNKVIRFHSRYSKANLITLFKNHHDNLRHHPFKTMIIKRGIRNSRFPYKSFRSTFSGSLSTVLVKTVWISSNRFVLSKDLSIIELWPCLSSFSIIYFTVKVSIFNAGW